MKDIPRHKIYVDRVEWVNKLLDKIAYDGLLVCIEIGIWKADFTKLMLESRNDLFCYGVDPYTPYGRMRRQQNDWNNIYDRVVRKMQPFHERFKLVRKTSNDALPFVPAYVDWVFIDGNHDYEFVLNDLKLYEPLIRPGGIMSGHDYTTPKDGVRRAVNEYVKMFDRKLNVDSSFDKSGVYWWQI